MSYYYYYAFFRENEHLDFNPLAMQSLLEAHSNHILKCQLCGKLTCKGQIMRHLTKTHKVCSIMANQIRSSIKMSKNLVRCQECGKSVDSLKKHLLQYHRDGQSEARNKIKIIKETNRERRENILSEDFIAKFNRFITYQGKHTAYKRDSKYDPCRNENIKRMAIKFATNGSDLAELLEAPADAEIEESYELIILDYIDTLYKEGKSPETAIVYLNDLKKFVCFFFRYHQRKPYETFILQQISICKKTRVGKMNLNKYEDRINLVQKVSHHYHCSLSVEMRGKLEETFEPQTPTPWMTEARNFLMARLLIENAQRPGAICNMTLEEFNNPLETTEGKMTIPVADHKTAQHSGPANIHCSTKLYKLIGTYIKYVRPESQSKYVFLTSSGHGISSSCSWGILNRHFSKCDIGIPNFNQNSWRRAFNTKIQDTGEC